MNSDNQSGQISQAARINFCGEPKTEPVYSFPRKSIYDMAFYCGDEKWDDEYSLNTTTWD